jgi:hypothetical protein
MQLVGHNTIEDRGANFQLSWYGDYAYVGMAHVAERDDPMTDDPLWGTAVINASDPQNPKVTTVLDSPANFNAWEAMSVSESRELLVVSGNTEFFEVFDLSDPANPRLLSSQRMPLHSHGLVLSPDGKTAYVTDNSDADPGLVAYDLSDPSHPEVIATHAQNGHDPGISLNGLRLYQTSRPRRGLMVFDVSEIERREFNPEFKKMGESRHSDGAHAGEAFRQNGRSYFITQDEYDADSGKFGGCPWGFARIYDVTDGWAPNQVSTFDLEVNKYVNCHLTQKDAGPNPGLLSAISFYSAHYNGLDRHRDPNVAFFSWYGSGLRVVDIRDVENPTGIGYYNPPPNPDTRFRQYGIWSQTTRFADGTTSYIRYRPELGHVWVVSVQNGFQILELTDGAREIAASEPSNPRPSGVSFHATGARP